MIGHTDSTKRAWCFIAALVCLFSSQVNGQEGVIQVRWKNGDILPGRLLPSDGSQMRFSSDLFRDELIINTSELDALEFESEKEKSKLGFLVGTTSGDVIKANLIEADDKSFAFFSKRHGRMQINRDAVYSLNRLDNPNLIFDGSQFNAWDISSKGPIRNLSYKVFAGENLRWGKPIDFTKSKMIKSGRMKAGFMDLGLAELKERFGMIFEGEIDIKNAGQYRLGGVADDKARMFIDGKLIFESTFPDTMSQRIYLGSGLHLFRLEFTDYGGEQRLSARIQGPEGSKDFQNLDLVGENDSVWRKGEGGHPLSITNKKVLFRPIEVSDHFNLDLELSSNDSPRFVFALGQGEKSAESDGALKLETWDNELVVVQDQIFEAVMTIKDGQKNVRLRLSYDGTSRELQIFNANGNLLIQVEDVQIPIGKTGVSIRNRGEDLSVQRLVFYRDSRVVDQGGIDTKKPRVLMVDGRIYYGRLFVSEQETFVMGADMTRQDVDLSKVDRILNPEVKSLNAAYSSELIYNDEVIVRGELIQSNPTHVTLQTSFSEQPVECSLMGASSLRFHSTQSKAEASGSRFDQMIYPEGSLRGHITFELPGSPLGWRPDGSKSALRLTGIGTTRIERNPRLLQKFLPFDQEKYPHLLYLRHGEIIPCSVSSYDKEEFAFVMPFNESTKKVKSSWIKAIEFDPLRTLKSQNFSSGAELIGSGADWNYLLDSANEKAVDGWTNVDFDDGAFAFGPAGFGYGVEDVATEVPRGTTVVLMRHEFNLKEAFKSESLFLQVDYDDGFVAYLNGTRVAESNAPDGGPTLDSMATDSHESGELEQFDISAHVGLLRQGENALAIAGLNNSKSSSDLLIHPVLATEVLAKEKNNDLDEWLSEVLGPEESDDNEVDPIRLHRALTVPRFSRKNPPNHLLVAKNGDIKRGTLLGIKQGEIRFESKFKPFSVPVERLAKVVSVTDLIETAQVDEISLNYDFKAQTRMFLVDGSILDLEVKKTEEDFLFGHSKIYGEVALPTKIIEKINLGGFESDSFKVKFDEWIVTPAQEPDFGKKPKAPTGPDKEKKQIQASIVPEEKPSGRKDASGLVIPEKFSNRVKKIGADLYRVGDVTIDSKLQVAAFPAKVNQIVGLIEYALVTDSGKLHESFLSTKIKPGDVHVAMLLLGVKPPGNVSVEIAWQEDGKWTRKSITNCIAQYPLEVASEQEDKETGKSFDLKSSSWTWTGSRVRPSGILVADELGSILSLQADPDALSLVDPMIDTSRFGSHVWSKKVPKKDSMVQIFIQPFETEKNAKS